VVGIDHLIDQLVANEVFTLQFQPSAQWFGAVKRSQVLFDEQHQFQRHFHETPFAVVSSRLCQSLGCLRKVMPIGLVAQQFAADRAWGAMQQTGNGLDVQTIFISEHIDLLALSQAKLLVAHEGDLSSW
jgi:hypothetical protein